MSTCLVTGAASGIGRALATRLFEAGHTVHATDIEPAGLAELPDGIATHRVDVRSDADVARLFAETGPVELLVNNAGIGAWGTQEEADLDAVRDMFEVNVFGVARVTQAYLPGIRAKRGVVVQISSISARIVFPSSGFYAASKHALEGMTEALYQEVAPDGVRVRVIEPGSIESGFQAAAAGRTHSPATSHYNERHATWNARREALLASPQSPERVADVVIDSLADPRGFLRLAVGADAERLLAMRDQLSQDEWVRLMAERNGALQGLDSPIADPSDPNRVTDARRLANTYTALMLGHLDHWSPQAVAAWRTTWRTRFAGL